MKKVFLLLAAAAIQAVAVSAQNIQSPSEFLDYPLGSQFTYHHRALDYLKYVAAHSEQILYRSYGQTWEGRELGVVFVSSPGNLERLEDFRRTNLAKTGLSDYEGEGQQIPFVWLSYNLHGNESVGMEAALKVVHALVSDSVEDAPDWLQSCIIVIDPCLNPDGRERYAVNYRMLQPALLNADPNSWERYQPWPGARSNHYFFDLNRDWTWQTQIETRQRLALYHEFMPHVHADFHEMGVETNYFFPPGAEPVHEAVTGWQREFHQLTGKANARLFDEAYRLYYSGETFDLFSPSYGDTWPLFNGAMGFTYEQAGSGRAGLAVRRELGDTLTLAHRIEGHYLSSLATIRVAHENRERLISGFNQYFETARTHPPFEYHAVIVKGDNKPSAIKAMLELLDNNKIEYSLAKPDKKSYQGFDYLSGREGRFSIEAGDILVPAHQPQGHFVRVLFEPESLASDSVSYDLTAWGLPYVFNLRSYALKERIEALNRPVFEKVHNPIPASKPYAYLADWDGFDAARFLAALYRNGLRVRSITRSMTVDGREYSLGSLIVARGDNTQLALGFDSLVVHTANTCGVRLHPATSGLAEVGIDFGSRYAMPMTPPAIATLGGEGIAAGVLGELRYFFEQELEYPMTVIHTAVFGAADLSAYQVLILPPGNYQQFGEKILDFVRSGGKVLAIGNASSIFAEMENTALGRATKRRTEMQKAGNDRTNAGDEGLLVRYEDVRRHAVSDRSAAAIYRVDLDDSHPYTYGMGNPWFIMKQSTGLPYLETGNNIGYITRAAPVAGFAGYRFQETVKNTLVIGSERLGRGEVVYLSDNPYFRAYWKSGRMLLGNILLK